MPNALRDRVKWLKEKLRPRWRSSSRPTTPLYPAPNSAVSDTNNAFGVQADSEDTVDKLSAGSMFVTAMPDENLQATVVSNTNPNRLTVSVDRPVISQPSLGHGPTATAAKFPTAQESAITGAAAALRLVQSIANIVKKVPVIAPAAALMSEILTIYEGVKNMSDQRRTLLAKVEELSLDVCRMVLRMEATGSLDLIGQLKPDIDTYTELLVKASGYIKEYDAQSKTLHALVAKDFAGKFSALTQELVSFGSTFRKHEDIGNHRKPGTGLWILERNDFITWQHNPGSLWIRGPYENSRFREDSAVINALLAYRQLFIARRDPKPPAVAFFYFDFKDKESHQVKKALQDLVLQLSAQSPKPYETLHELYVESNNGQTLPTYKDLMNVFEKLLLEIQDTYIVLDALDECQEPDFEQLLNLMSKLQSWTRTTPLHLLITSQPRNLFNENSMDMPCIELSSYITHEDIKLFVSSELHARRNLKNWAPQTYITEKILQKSSGMFRLAACLLDELSRRRPDPDELDKILDSLPNELFGIYSWWLEAIPRADFVYAQGALRWLMYHKSGGGLHLESLADAIAFNFSTPAQYMYWPAQRMVNKEMIPRWLEGLVALDYSSLNPRVVLAHASVQDYLFSRQSEEKFQCDLSADISHTFIAQTCTGCLLYFTDHPLNEDTYVHPLGEYAASYWLHHLVQGHDRGILFTAAMQLLEEGSVQHDILIQFYTKKHHSAPAPPLHLCCREGYIEGVHALLTNTNIEIQDEECTPLHIASSRGHKDIAQLLLEKGANLHASMGPYGTLLQLAAAGMIKKVILLLLLAKGADVNAEGGWYGTALQEASRRGDIGLVKLLVQEGANMNARALEVAAFSGQLKMVEFLIGREVDMDSNDATGGTGYMALQAAALGGWLDIVQCLLDSKAAVNAEALYGGHGDIAELFLYRKADVNARGGAYPTALQAALYGGHINIAWELLKNEADVNAKCGGYPTALESAIYGGHIEIAHFLEKGADMNTQGHGTRVTATIITPKTHTTMVFGRKSRPYVGPFPLPIGVGGEGGGGTVGAPGGAGILGGQGGQGGCGYGAHVEFGEPGGPARYPRYSNQHGKTFCGAEGGNGGSSPLSSGCGGLGAAPYVRLRHGEFYMVEEISGGIGGKGGV
ncbi:hypothetical protein K438DRAFT_1760480 [Mycena galopus ATCC 62051]|nr:hypothetical protein K438DRAFT_1760480 [Mycena galopus ATCC 62051]